MDVLDVIGNFGRFQKEMIILVSLRSLTLPTTFFLVNLMSSPVDHWCTPVEPYRNLSANEWKQCCVPESKTEYSQCQRYELGENFTIINHTGIQCQEWSYEKEKQVSLRADWDMVCDRKWLMALLYFMFFTGNLVSYPIAGYFADRFGRKPCCLLGCAGLTLTILAVSLSNSLVTLMVFRFLTGIAYVFLQIAPLTLFLEVSGRRQRALLSIITGCVWALSAILMMVIANHFSSWRYFNLVGCIHLPYMLLLWKFCPESPRWLVASRKWEEAGKTLELAARKNGIIIHDVKSVLKSLEEKLDTIPESRQGNFFKQVFKHKKLFLIYTVLLISFLTNKLIAFGFVISLRALGGNFQINFLISSASTIVGSLLSILVQSIFTNRRLILLLGYALTAIIFLVSTTLGEELLWLRIAVAVMGDLSNTVLSSTLVLFASEVAPTNMRSTSSSICQVAGRIGASLSSFTDLLSQKYGNNASLILFGVMAFLTASGYFFVPNVDNRNLPDTLEEANRNMLSRKRGDQNHELNDLQLTAVPENHTCTQLTSS